MSPGKAQGLEAPHRVRLSRKKGWRMPPNTVKVDRTTRWGNPFHVQAGAPSIDRARAVEQFENLLATDSGYWARTGTRAATFTTAEDIQRELAGKNLACWCSLDGPCHADVLLSVARTAHPLPNLGSHNRRHT